MISMSISSDGSLSLSEFKALNFEAIKTPLYAQYVNTYEIFLCVVYQIIDEIVRDMEQHRNRYENHDEDDITNHIRSVLRLSHGFDVGAIDSNGATDLTIKWPGREWVWTGEAKIDHDHPKVLEGLLQLTTRYATGADYESEGGVLIYCKKHPIGDFMGSFRENLESSKWIDERGVSCLDLQVEDCDLGNRFAFRSSSLLPQIGGGIRYRTRFIPVGLFHCPRDKSGRKAQKYNKS